MDIQKIKQIFFPAAYAATLRAKNNGNKFAYYTTAEVAYQIIRNKQIWMRSTTTMNDYMEIEYGRELLLLAHRDAAGIALKSAVDECHPGIFEEAWEQVISWLPGFWADTFITCISEHDLTENELGRLSMWRAYGGKTGVALVINGEVLTLETNALGAYASPVSYLTRDQFFETVKSVAANIANNADYVRRLPRDQIKLTLFTMFRFAVLCTKHPGFAEEREWRIVASPAMYPSELLKLEIAVVQNVPQPILKLPLNDYPEHGVIGLTIPSLINHVIIGPCEFPHVTFRALWTELKHAGVDAPDSIIVKSEIPLRHA